MNAIFHKDAEGTWQPFRKMKHLLLEVLTAVQLIKAFPLFMNLEDLFPYSDPALYSPLHISS
jgi:hypothetical protein